MSADSAYLALMLDAPLQSWGFASRFQRRTTGLHPTKSGVIGLICAAMGVGKGSDAERDTLPQLSCAQNDQHRHAAIHRFGASRTFIPSSIRDGQVAR